MRSVSNPLKFIGALFVLCTLTLVVYYPVFEAGPIIDDDKFYINDPVMTASDGWVSIWLNPSRNNQIWSYVPISRTTFWLERQLWGLDLRVSHGINVFLHLLTSILLWLALAHLGVRGAWIIGVLFALHPVHVQSVAWIAERRNVLASIFYISSLWGYLRFEKSRKELWYWAAWLLFLGALLSKTSSIMLPAVLIFARLWLGAKWGRADVVRLLPFFLLSLGIGGLRIWFETHSLSATGPAFDLNFLERILLAGHIPFFYLGKLIFPYPLLFNYSKWDINFFETSMYFPIISVGVVLGVSLWKYEKWGKGIFLGLASFGATLFPVLGFFNIAWTQFSYVTDHWVYLPSISILILAVQGGCKILDKSGLLFAINLSKILVGTTIILILTGIAWRQVSMYNNPETLWQNTLLHNPNSWLAYQELGGIFARKKQYQPAFENYHKALQLHDSALGYTNRGVVYYILQNYDQAIKDHSTALNINPNFAQAYFNRGNTFFKLGRNDQALQDYSRALQINPDYAQAYFNRGVIYFNQHQYDQALEDFNNMLSLKPKSAKAHNSRGLIHQILKNKESACSDWKTGCLLGQCEYYTQAQSQNYCL